VGILAEILVEYVKFMYGMRMENSRYIVGSSCVLMIWSRLALNFWDAESSYFETLWLESIEAIKLARPGFRGVLRPSPLNAAVEELYYPAFWYLMRRLVASVLTTVFCVFVVFCILMWIGIFEGHMNLAASVCLSLQIKIFEFIYNSALPFWLEFENHKYQSAMYDSYLWKQMLFQSVNYYTAFLYLAFVQPFTSKGCPEGGCLHHLRQQLGVVQIVIVVCEIGKLAFTHVRVNLAIRFEAWQIKRNGGPPHTVGFVERQRYCPAYRTLGGRRQRCWLENLDKNLDK
jgi:hypothetical protein